jgi:ribosomal protein S17E
MTSDQSIISLINKTKWKSFEKLNPIVKQKHPNITSKQLREIIASNITHDIKTPLKSHSKYFNKIFSNHRHSYQMDLLINNPTNYLVLININTRYVILKSIADRSTTSIVSALKSVFK